ncbi:GDSL-type esterase/lipase family protein [Kitasatospora sp. P5_F3]
MSTPYSWETAAAVSLGYTDAGWIERSGGPADDLIASYCNAAIEERSDAMFCDLRDNLAALRRDLHIPSIGTVRIYCVGDSITAGSLSPDGMGYRSWLADFLDRRHITSTLSVCAYPGQTLAYVAPIAVAQLPAVQPDIVLIHLGTNEAMQNDMTNWSSRLGTFVDQILASSPTIRVAVARIEQGRDAATAARETTINTWVDQVVAARKGTGRVVTADMTGIPSRWTSDGTHPLPSGHRGIAERWLAAINPWLPQTP